MKNSKDKKTNENKSKTAWVLWIVVIASLVIVGIFVCANVFFIIPNMSSVLNNLNASINSEKIDVIGNTFISEMLSAALTIIGLAVSVWTGLNIVNAIERKEYDVLKENVKKTDRLVQKTKRKVKAYSKEVSAISQSIQSATDKLQAIEKKQAESDRMKLINEMYYTEQDLSTRVLIEKIRDIDVSEEGETKKVDFLRLLEIERLFNSVYHLHESTYSRNEVLLNEAEKGIRLATELLTKTMNNTVRFYLKYRIAEFNFYSGYCCDVSKRDKFFRAAIQIYLETGEFFGACKPPYEEEQVYPNIKCKEIRRDSAKISAYFCNSIGEAYSKIIEHKDKILCEKKDVNDYGLKAIYYCAYAAHWDNRETYWRNLGCAIERHYKSDILEQYEVLHDVYNKALSINATPNAFKVLLSVSDKYINKLLGIEDVIIEKGRQIPLNNQIYEEKWENMEQSDRESVLSILSENFEQSNHAKILYPIHEVGYTYSCLYHRDMCLILVDSMEERIRHLQLAKKDFELLRLIKPEGNLTKILEKDLIALEKIENQ